MLWRSHILLWTSEYIPKQWAGRSAVSSVTQKFRAMEHAVAVSEEEKARRGFFHLPQLDYDVESGIPPLCSKKQFDIQFNLFHKDAVERLNTHTLGSELEGHNLDVVLRETAFDATRAVVHAAAAEHFNYCFWYKSLRPWGSSVPSRLRNDMQLYLSKKKQLSDPVAEVQRRMTITALSQEDCCGWVYLVWTGKNFDVLHFYHGLCPISSDLIPLLAINIHESAFILDYERSTKGLEAYLSNFFKTCNWTLADIYYGAAIEKE